MKCPSWCQPTGHLSTTINHRAVRRPSQRQPTGQHHQWSTPEQPNVHHVVNLLDSHCDVSLLDIHHDAGLLYIHPDVVLLDSITKDQLQSSETSFMMLAYWTASPKISSRAAKCPSCCQPTGHPSWCWPTGYPSWCRPTGQHHQRSAPKEWNVHHVSAYRTPSPMINHRAVRRPSWCRPTGHHHQRSAPERPADPHR